MKMHVRHPFRFIGPMGETEAEQIAEIMLDGKKLKETLLAFLKGEIEPQELAYDIQAVAENAEETLAESTEDEGLED